MGQLLSFEQLGQVAVTYVTRFWLAAAVCVIWLAMLVVALTARMGNPSSDFQNVQVAGAAFICIGISLPWLILGSHVKSQFAHSRAALVPGFAAAHVAMAALLLAVTLLVLPFVAAGWLGVNRLGALALCVAAAAGVIWGAQSDGRWCFVTIGLGSTAAFSTRIAQWWMLPGDQHAGAHLLIFLFGWLAISAWLWRLCRLREEMADYEPKFAWPAVRRGGAETIENRRLVAKQFGRGGFAAWISDYWLARIGGFHADRWWRTVRLLRFGFSGVPMEFNAPLFVVIYLIMAYGMSFILPGNNPRHLGPSEPIFVQFVLLMLISGAMGGEQLVKRRPRLAAELLRPLCRTRLVDGLIAAGAWNSAIYWVVINACVLITVSQFWPDHFTPSGVSTLLLLSLSCGSLVFAECARLAVLDSMVMRMIRLFPAMLATITALMTWFDFRDNIGDWPFAIIGICIGLIALSSLRSARRAWMNLELG